MKKMLVALGIMAMGSRLNAAYINGGAGIRTVSDNSDAGVTSELRFGTLYGPLDVSAGYVRDFLKVGNHNLLPSNLELHTLNTEAYLTVPLPSIVRLKIGGGVGYTIPNVDATNMERLDNNLSGLFGGKLEVPVGPVTVGVATKYHLFHTDSHRTTMLTESETIYRTMGHHKIPIGVVETETPVYTDNSINFNSVSVLFGVTYTF